MTRLASEEVTWSFHLQSSSSSQLSLCSHTLVSSLLDLVSLRIQTSDLIWWASASKSWFRLRANISNFTLENWIIFVWRTFDFSEFWNVNRNQSQKFKSIEVSCCRRHSSLQGGFRRGDVCPVLGLPRHLRHHCGWDRCCIWIWVLWGKLWSLLYSLHPLHHTHHPYPGKEHIYMSMSMSMSKSKSMSSPCPCPYYIYFWWDCDPLARNNVVKFHWQ